MIGFVAGDRWGLGYLYEVQEGRVIYIAYYSKHRLVIFTSLELHSHHCCQAQYLHWVHRRRCQPILLRHSARMFEFLSRLFLGHLDLIARCTVGLSVWWFLHSFHRLLLVIEFDLTNFSWARAFGASLRRWELFRLCCDLHPNLSLKVGSLAPSRRTDECKEFLGCSFDHRGFRVAATGDRRRRLCGLSLDSYLAWETATLTAYYSWAAQSDY